MTDEDVWMAIERLADAQERQNELLERRNAILAVLAMNHEHQYRQQARNEEPTSYSYTWTRFAADMQDALHTFEEDLDR